MNRRGVLAAVLAAPFAALAITHAGFEADAFNRVVSAAYEENAVFSPFSFEIDTVVFAEAHEPITKAYFAEKLGVLNGLGAVYPEKVAFFADAEATNRFALTCCRGFIFPKIGAVRRDYRTELQASYLSGVCAAYPKAGAEAWFRAKLDGLMDDFTISERASRSSHYSYYDVAVLRFSWAEPFPSGATAKMPFVRADGSRTEVETMRDLRTAELYTTERFTMLRLPLVGSAAFYVLLPAKDLTVGDIRSEFTSQKVDALLQMHKSVTEPGVSRGPVEIALPKIALTNDWELQNAFAYLRFPVKKFQRIAEGETPYEIRQRMRLAVDERGLDPDFRRGLGGLEATARPAGTRAFTADRPFLFFVHHEPTGTIPVAGLFMGKDSK